MYDDFNIPDGLSKLGEKAAKAIVKKVKELDPYASGGGCTAFYSPQEWKDRGEEWGCNSELIVVYDGGDLAPYFNGDDDAYELRKIMVEELDELGVYTEECTCWYSSIHLQ